jgi:drug/metabolite transporter (DMT)-like permease
MPPAPEIGTGSRAVCAPVGPPGARPTRGVPRRLWRSGVFWILVTEVLFAIMRVATRWGAADRLSGWEVGGVRFLGGALVAYGLGRARRVPLRVGDQKNAWLRSLFGTLNACAVFLALGSPRIAVGDVATLSATAPLFVALLSGPVLGERVSPRVVAGAVLGFTGVAVLSRPALHVSGDLALALLLGALSYGLAILRLRRLGPRESSEAIALHMSLVAGVVMLLLSLPRFTVPTPRALLPLALSAAAGGLGQVTMSRAYGLGRAARLSAVSYAGVVFTYLLEALSFARRPGLHQWAGAGLVVIAGVVVSARSRASADAELPAPPTEAPGDDRPEPPANPGPQPPATPGHAAGAATRRLC